ncbi:MAG: hypothetical protein MZU97_24360 [Bacillus subtilis]|nr:hypothetical protein [Bacillus subtilis]
MLAANTPTKVTIRIWIEGWDARRQQQPDWRRLQHCLLVHRKTVNPRFPRRANTT